MRGALAVSLLAGLGACDDDKPLAVYKGTPPSIDSLPTMVEKMAEHQSARGKLTAQMMTAIVAFLGSLTGELPKDLIAAPTLPASGPQTPHGGPG